MNISKLNPIGYEAKTAKGNTYKKSNMVKTAIVGASLVGTALELTSKNKIVQQFSTRNMLEGFGIKNPKLLAVLVPVVIAFDLGVSYLLGKWADDAISEKRAQKADMNA